MSMTSDRQLECTACGAEFTFSGEEQDFYFQKGFQDPKKCKPCRAAAKDQRRGGGGGGGFRGGGGRPQKQLFDAICAGCNIQTQVPFQPNGSKPVYCKNCYQSQRSYY